jgi:pilus assembly protein Flp/PilA
MKSIKRGFLQLWRQDEGLTTVEYAVAGGLISAAVIAAFTALGGTVQGVINWLATNIPAT